MEEWLEKREGGEFLSFSREEEVRTCDVRKKIDEGDKRIEGERERRDRERRITKKSQKRKSERVCVCVSK